MEAFYSMAQGIFERLAMYEYASASCQEVQSIVREWQQYISEHFYECNKQVLSYLGALYVTDERFTGFINRFGHGSLKVSVPPQRFNTSSLNCDCRSIIFSFENAEKLHTSLL